MFALGCLPVGDQVRLLALTTILPELSTVSPGEIHYHTYLASPGVMMLRGTYVVNTSTPAVVLASDTNAMHHGELGVIRSLGRVGGRTCPSTRAVPTGAGR